MRREVELDLIRLAQAGDRVAEGRLLEQYRPLCWRLALKMAPTASDQDDFYQVARLAFWLGLCRWRPGHGAKPSSFAYHYVLGYLLKQRKKTGLIQLPVSADHTDPKFDAVRCPVPLGDESESIARLKMDPAEELETRINRLQLLRAVDELPGPCGLVIRARLQGETMIAIGRRMGRTKEWVRILENRGRQQLREKLGVN